MPKILIFKKSVLVAFAGMLFAAISVSANAQCVFKKVKKNGITYTEIPERYVYNRTATDYNALSVTLSQAIKSNGPVYTLNLKFAFSNISRKGQWLDITFANGEEIKLPMRFTALAKTDNPRIHLNTYTVDLPADIIQKLSDTPVKTIGVNSMTNFKFSEVFTPEESLFTDMFKCVKTAAQ